MEEVNINARPRIIATGNDGTFHKYTFEKTEDFKKDFIDLMNQLGFENFDSNFANKSSPEYFWHRSVSKEDKLNEEDEEYVCVEPPISFFTDMFHRFENENYDLELFLGEKKAIITVRIKAGDRRKVVDKVLENPWPTEKDFEKNSEEIKNYLRGFITKHSVISN